MTPAGGASGTEAAPAPAPAAAELVAAARRLGTAPVSRGTTSAATSKASASTAGAASRPSVTTPALACGADVIAAAIVPQRCNRGTPEKLEHALLPKGTHYQSLFHQAQLNIAFVAVRNRIRDSPRRRNRCFERLPTLFQNRSQQAAQSHMSKTNSAALRRKRRGVLRSLKLSLSRHPTVPCGFGPNFRETELTE
jgi:hypothetical protein